MIKKFNEFINDNIKEGYLRRIMSSEINKEERTEDTVSRERTEKIEKIKSWLDKMGIKNYTIDDISLKIDVDGSVDLTGKKINGKIIPQIEGCKLPDYIKFREIKGNFNCSNNKLTSLKGFPENVYGNFDCSYNQLISLEGCPTEIKGYFVCTNNQLTSLEYCPEIVYFSFICSCDNLEDFETGYKNKVKIGNNFICYYSEKNKNKIENKDKDIKKYFDIKGNIFIYIN